MSETTKAVAAWKVSGNPCFWCWVGDKPRGEECEDESLVGLHVITGPGGYVFIGGCRTRVNEVRDNH